MNGLDLLSYCGMVCLLIAVAITRKKRFFLIADILNFLGAFSLVIWAGFVQAWAIFILDSVWLFISFFTFIRDIKKKLKKSKKSSLTEEYFLSGWDF